MQVVLRMHAPKGLKIWKIHKMYISVLHKHRQNFISIQCHTTEIFGGTWKNYHPIYYIIYFCEKYFYKIVAEKLIYCFLVTNKYK